MTRDAWAKLRDYPARGPRRIVGLMTGTSADAIDAALVRFDAAGAAARPVLERYRETPLDEALRGWILDLAGAEAWRPEALMELDAELGERYAVAVKDLLREAGLEAADLDAIASHGQTVRHLPRGEDAGRARTLQIGSAAILAERTGIAVVSDFRSRDTAAGGEGAPLVPMADAWLFGSDEESRVLLNLGGMANLTVLPKGRRGEAFAFDTGPGNALIDDWVRRHTGRSADLDGALARAGQISAEHVARFLQNSYFDRKPPKSLDRDDFRDAMPQGLAVADGAATLTEMTAACVTAAQRHFPTPPREWLVCGGGRHNPVIMAALARLLAVPVRPVEAVGWNGDALEAQAFAYLAVRSVVGLPLSLPSTTGAPHPVCGGRLFEAPR